MLKYPGGSMRRAAWTVAHFPRQWEGPYVEPFFGGGGVYFAAESRLNNILLKLSDWDQFTVNFWYILRVEGYKLINTLRGTKYDINAFQMARMRLKGYDGLIKDEDRFGLAVATYLVHRLSFNGIGETYAVSDTRKRRGLHETESAIYGDLDKLSRLDVPQVNCHRWQMTGNAGFAYLDPPYLPSTRSHKLYRVEMSELDHIELLDWAVKFNGPVLISGFNNKLYSAKLKDWNCSMRWCHYGAGEGVECIWYNY